MRSQLHCGVCVCSFWFKDFSPYGVVKVKYQAKLMLLKAKLGFVLFEVHEGCNHFW